MSKPSTAPTVWMDTNFVVHMGKPGSHVPEQLREMLGPQVKVRLAPSVKKELAERLADSETARQARLGLQAIGATAEKMGKKYAGSADDDLEQLARRGALVATLDGALRKRIKAFGGRLLYLKKGNRIALD
jgi:rRNA-processing protein FCF1